MTQGGHCKRLAWFPLSRNRLQTQPMKVMTRKGYNDNSLIVTLLEVTARAAYLIPTQSEHR